MGDGAIRHILERSIDKLPDELRTVFVACAVDGMTPAASAEYGGGTSAQGRSLLGEVLIRQFGPASDGVYQLNDSRSERITNALMDRFFRAGEAPYHVDLSQTHRETVLGDRTSSQATISSCSTSERYQS